MATKYFPTADILTVATGVMMRTPSEFHGVMDHLYPGIMTISAAAMQSRAAEVIIGQHPKLREFLRVNGPVAGDLQSVDACLSLAHACFGSSLPIDGPAEVSDGEAEKAFGELLARASP